MKTAARVLYVISSEVLAGAERYLSRLERGVRPHVEGTRIVVLAGSEPTPLIDEYGRTGAEVRVVPSRELSWHTVRRLRNEIRDFEPTVVHSNLPRADLLCSLALSGSRRRQVVTLHNLDPRYRSAKGRLLQSVVLLRADAVIAPSMAVRRYAEATSIGFATKIRMVPHGIESMPTRSDNDRECVQVDKRTVAVVGRVIRGKGHEDVIAAIAVEPSRWRLLVVGDGPDVERLRSLAAEMSVEAEFTGHVADVAAALVGVDVVACPTRSAIQEGFGYAALEAMATGVPVVVSDVGALPEVVDGLGERLIFREGDAGDLREALEFARANGLSLSRNGIERARSTFSIDLMVVRTLSAYKQFSGE